MLLPPIISRIEDDGIPRYSQAKEAGSTLSKMRLATYNTTKAASKALVLSSIDGPLPILDVVALGYFTIAAIASWSWVIDDLFD